MDLLAVTRAKVLNLVDRLAEVPALLPLLVCKPCTEGMLHREGVQREGVQREGVQRVGVQRGCATTGCRDGVQRGGARDARVGRGEGITIAPCRVPEDCTCSTPFMISIIRGHLRWPWIANRFPMDPPLGLARHQLSGRGSDMPNGELTMSQLLPYHFSRPGS